MEISYLNPIFYSYYFKIIEANLFGWNLDPVERKGFYRKMSSSKYGHIELKFYKTIESDHSNKIIWNISDKQIPSDYNYKPHVERVLTFFIENISALKGDSRISLTFEINPRPVVGVPTKHICVSIH